LGQALRREGPGYAPAIATGAEQVGEAVVQFNHEERSARATLGSTLIELSGGSTDDMRAVVAALKPLNG
jgi:hypothetical protein